jgi:Family of unknown function (DUF5681)
MQAQNGLRKSNGKSMESDSQAPHATATAPGRAAAWKPGQSGNPKGRAVGCRNKASLIAEALIGEQTEELTRKAIDLALAGDVIALRLCLERILPPARQRPCSFKLPRLETCSDAIAALALIAGGLASGKLLPHEAESLGNVVAAFVKTIAAAEFESRLIALEKANAEDASREHKYDA